MGPSSAPARTGRGSGLLVLGSILVLLILLMSSGARAARGASFSNGQSSSLVLGQTDFVSMSSGAGQTGLSDPEVLAFDGSGNLWVADAANNRVLEFNAPLATGEAASLVLGEPDFASTSGCLGTSIVNSSCLTTPLGMAFDHSGNLWVSDTGQDRVLEFTAPFSNYEKAALVMGQPDFVTGSNPDATPSASDFKAPKGLAFDSSGSLWVADTGFNRVLKFTAPFANGESATLAIGQSNFTSGVFPDVSGCPPNCPPAQASINGPIGLAFDSSGNLWVSAWSDHRVLEYSQPFSMGQNAALVIGGPDFNSNYGFCPGLNPDKCVSPPDSIAFDSSGNLWVSDIGDGRVLAFPAPFSTGESAGLVLGLPDLASSPPLFGGPSASNMSSPNGLAFDSKGDLWVADTGFNRVLEFVPGTAAVTTSNSPSATSTTTAAPQTTTAQQQPSTTTTQSTAASTSSSGGGIPEFPYQLLTLGAFTAVVVAAYLAARRMAPSASHRPPRAVG